MKPTRGVSSSWLGSLPRERRMAVVSVAVLLALLGAIVLYQQLQVPVNPPLQPEPTEAPPVTAGPALEAPSMSPPDPATPTLSTPSSTRLNRPLAGLVEVIKLYGSMDEAYGDLRYYRGIAYATAPGHHVLAAALGVVESVEHDPADGRTIVVRHSDSLSTRYAGLGKVLVTEGDQVEAGAMIAVTGEPPVARAELGPHLAFEVWRNGEAIDPALFLND